MAVSIFDVAHRAGVSKSTVSRVLTNDPRVRPSTRVRVEAAIRELGFRPSALARGLAYGRTRTLGLIVFDLANPFFSLLVRGAETAARQRGYNVLIGDTAGSTTQQESCVSMLAERRVDGLLMTPLHMEEADLAAIYSVGITTVLVNCATHDSKVSSVGADDVAGGFLAVQHLIGLGHTRIAFLGDRATLPSCRDRCEGYRQAHDAAGLTPDPSIVLNNLEDLSAASAAVHALMDLRDPPTALFAVNDQFAMAALQALTEQHLRVPDDVSLVGYDDLPVAAWLSVPLTTVAQPREEQGRIAATLLINAIEHPETPVEHIVLQPHLVMRHSSGMRRTLSMPSAVREDDPVGQSLRFCHSEPLC